MVRNKTKCSTQFISLVDKLYSGKSISSVAADEAKKEYDFLLDAAQQEHKDAFLTFDYRKESVDKFIATFVHGNTRYKNCWNICQLIFALSHGQASVERGFSVNKELLVVLVSQGIVYDYFFSTEKTLSEFQISNELIKSCKLAHTRYTQALQTNTKTTVQCEKDRKRKLKMEEIATVKEKKQALESCVKSLQVDIEKYSIEAEEKKDFNILAKANSFRTTAKTKQETT